MLLKKVKLSEIKEAVYQPRQQKEKDIEELIKSILNCGLLTNMTLRKEKKKDIKSFMATEESLHLDAF